VENDRDTGVWQMLICMGLPILDQSEALNKGL